MKRLIYLFLVILLVGSVYSLDWSKTYDQAYCKLTGCTMTGDLIVPNLNSLGNITASEIYDSSLVLDMRFDAGSDGSDTYDSSIYGNDGDVSDATWDSKGGVKGGAYEFDADDDYIAVADSPSLRPTEFTISAWVFRKGLGGGGKGVVVQKDGVDGYYVFRQAGDYWKLFVGGQESTITGFSINDNEWQHIVFMMNGTDILSYNNGVFDNSEVYTGTISYSTTDLTIGNRPDLARDFNGSIDEVEVWNRALSSAEVSEIYEENNHLFLNDLKSENITTDYLQVEKESWWRGALHIFDNVKTYFGSADDISMEFNGSDFVVKAEVGTPNYYLEGFNEIKIDTNIIAENVFLPAYIRSASNDTIPVVGVGVWTNISFSKGADPLKENIGHIWNDVTNETFTINDGGIYHISYTISIRDTSPNPTAHVGFDMAYDTGSRVQGSYSELDTSKENEDIFVHNSFSTEFNDGDVILVRFIASDEDVSVIPHGTYNPSPASAQLSLHKVANS